MATHEKIMLEGDAIPVGDLTGNPSFASMTTDQINEKTANAGVTIEGVLLKDGVSTPLGGLLSSAVDLQYERDASDSLQTRNEDGYADITGASITVTAPGKFLILFTTDAWNDTASKGVWIKLLRDATKVGNERLYGGSGGPANCVGPLHILEVEDLVDSGDKVYKVQFQRHQGGTAKIQRWTFIVLKFKT